MNTYRVTKADGKVAWIEGERVVPQDNGPLVTIAAGGSPVAVFAGPIEVRLVPERVRAAA